MNDMQVKPYIYNLYVVVGHASDNMQISYIYKNYMQVHTSTDNNIPDWKIK